MKLGLLTGVCLGAVLFSSTQALADDTGSVAYMNSWTGFHAGIVGGYGWGRADMSAIVEGISEDGSADLNGAMIGAIAGYDYDFGNGLVAGVVGDWSWLGISGDGCVHPDGVSCSISQSDVSVDTNWLATMRLRAGFAFDDALIYATGGLAVGGVDVAFDSPLGGGGDSHTQLGWTVGIGAEYRISDPLSIGIEYLYVDLGKQSYDFSGEVEAKSDVNLDLQILRANLQWRF